MPTGTAKLCLNCMTLLSDAGPCPYCGWEPDEVFDVQYAKPGTVLSSRYVLGVYRKKNGEGALYPGYDNSLQVKVWIREYFPVAIAQRDIFTGQIAPLPGCGAQYKALMSDFVDVCNEVKRLGVTEPVVPIENVISENNTVYAIYRGLELENLESYLLRNGGKLGERETMELLGPVCSTLGVIHTHGHIHRGVSPFTVYVDDNGSSYLWDFSLSATRTAGSELDAELFSGYSAPEQYSPSGWQGSWTDVYAVGALFYRTLSGIVPPKSIRVGAEHPVEPLSSLVAELPENISEAVTQAMYPDTAERTQAIPTFLAELAERRPASTAVYDTNKVAHAKREKEERDRRGGSAKYVVAALFFTALVLVGLMWVFMVNFYPELMPVDGKQVSESGAESLPQDVSEVMPEDTVPSFVGMMAETVMADMRWIDRFDFTVKEEYNDNYEKGIIYDQYPVEGASMPERGTVILYVSLGKKQVEMPVLSGRTLEQALDILANLDIVPSVLTRYDPTADPGEVVGTYPEAGESFDPKRQTVIVYVMPELPVVEGSEQESQPEESSSSSIFSIFDNLD